MSGTQPTDESGMGDEPDPRIFRGGDRPAIPSPLPPASYDTESYMSLEDSDFEYHMRHKSRGIAVIINNDKFSKESQMSDRSGSSVDRDNLHVALKFVGFTDIRIHNNLPRKSMDLLIQELAREDFSDKDCLFVAILSHGDDGNIYGTDRSISYEKLLEPLKNEYAKTLVGKPKIFVIQACRGEKLDGGLLLQHDASPYPPEPPSYVISRESDFLLAYSVVPGYYSWRNCANGSWFIQAFCEVMKRDGRRLELVQILTRVNRMVSYTFKSNASSLAMTAKKQSPCITSMLTKSLFFA